MTTTDEFRHLLDERGVEWDYGITGAASTKFNANGVELTFIDMRDGVTCSTILTPEQVIAATLGRDNVGKYVGLRRGEYWERSENSDYYCGGCGWKVTDHDSYCPECGGALHEATLGDTDATQARRDVVVDVDEIIEHVINGNMLSMPYDVYVELFDAVDGLGVKIENLQSENAKLRELCGELINLAQAVKADSQRLAELKRHARNLGVET